MPSDPNGDPTQDAPAVPFDCEQALSEANVALGSGDLARAVWLLRQVVASRPDLVAARVALGDALARQGRLAEAIEAYDAALASQPDEAIALNNRGRARLSMGHYEKAEGDFRKALKLSPRLAEAHNNLAVCHRARGRLDDALRSHGQAIVLNPRSAAFWTNFAFTLRGQQDYPRALDALARSQSIEPEQPETQRLLAAIFLERGTPQEANAAARRLTQLLPSDADAFRILGLSEMHLGRTADAIDSLRTASSFNPSSATIRATLGTALKEAGQFGEAVQSLETAIDLDPEMAGAYLELAEIKSFSAPDDPLKVRMEALLRKRPSNPWQESTLHFAVAKALRDLGSYEEEFAHLVKGNDLRRRAVGARDESWMPYFAQARAIYAPDFIERHLSAGYRNGQAVFVIGMPRSGTSLIEQILAGHPEVTGAGEIKDFAYVANSLLAAAQRAPSESDIEFARRLLGSNLAEIGRRYSERLGAYGTAKYIVNKTPSNFFYAALIALSLPSAKIIHVVRDPIDTCVSCFSKPFAEDQYFSLDLRWLGRYYREYHDLMRYWRSVLPQGAILDVRYEDVVADIESQARRVFQYCGLEWNERALRFYATERSVRTASSVEVRRPIHQNSVGRWRRYQSFLQPLFSTLGDIDSYKESLSAIGSPGPENPAEPGEK